MGTHTKPHKTTLLNCIHCQNPFEAKKKNAKYCSTQCKNDYRNKQKDIESRKRQIWDGDKKICIICNIPKEISEYQTCGKDTKGNTKYKSKCKECMKAVQTAEHRRKRETYKFVCKHCGKPHSHYDKRFTTFCSRECSFAHAQGKEVYEPVLCKKCGGKKERKKTYCQPCYDIIKLEQEAVKAEQENWLKYKQNRERERQAMYRLNRIKKSLEREEKLKKTCSFCNQPFKAATVTESLCDKCKKVRDIIRDVQRGKRSKNSLNIDFSRFDDDINLPKLVERDKNVCYLCGESCDYDDYTHNENGAFIAGKRYPSTDHVIALANGGTHTWDNVKLACFECNTKKNAKTLQEVKGQLQFFL